MNWAKKLVVISRVVCALCIVGFALGCILWKKYEIFATILVWSGLVSMGYGLTDMLFFVIFGR